MPETPVMNGEWTTVRRKPGRKGAARTWPGAVVHRADGEPGSGEYSGAEVSYVAELVDRRGEMLRGSEWWAGIARLLGDAIAGRTVVALHCLGVGSFQASRRASFQFASAVAMKARFAGDARCTIADPAMGAVDRAVAAENGFEVVETTAVEGSAGAPTVVEVGTWGEGECVLWFMPHCPRELYEVVFAACGGVGYAGMVLFSNKLSEQRDGRSRERCPLLEGLVRDRRLVERDCAEPTLSSCRHTFNDLSIITIAEAGGGGGLV